MMPALVVAEGLLLLLAAGPVASRVLPDHVPHCEGERRHPMFIQNVLRRPAELTGAPPTIGPAALDSPDTLPAPPIARGHPAGAGRECVRGGL